MILFVNACVRKDSRTERIAKALIETLGDKCEEVKLSELGLKPVLEEALEKRTKLAEKGLFSDPMFEPAKQFSLADTIVIAAPFWDLSFPAILKTYLENIYVIGLVSEYNSEGQPHGLCKAGKLYYVTTAGGQYLPDFSYDYIRLMAEKCFGINETELIKAEMLDVEGFDAEKLVKQKIEKIKNNSKAEAENE